jgi:hypothetical protein
MSLRPWPVVISVHGEDIEIPAYPATDWLQILMKENISLEEILMELCPKGGSLLFDETLDPEELWDTLLDVVEQVSARHWWIALRVINVCRENWNVLGAEMFYRGIDPNILSLAAWLDAMLLLIIRAMDPKDVTMFIMKLEMIPAGEEPDDKEMEMSPEQFLSMG